MGGFQIKIHILLFHSEEPFYEKLYHTVKFLSSFVEFCIEHYASSLFLLIGSPSLGHTSSLNVVEINLLTCQINKN